MDLEELLGRRLAAQGLTGPPRASAVEVVRRTLGVQAQDPPLGRFSLGLRTGLGDSDVLAELATGEVVRTHVLRPTWHWVPREDLHWLLDLTAPRGPAGSTARHRQLGIDEDVRERAYAVLAQELAGGNHLTRKEIGPLLPTTDFPEHGQVVTHLLHVAEQDAFVVSGTPREGGEHTYALGSEVLPERVEVPREAAIERLVTRFVTGHGPTAEKDLKRWCTLPLTPMRAVLRSGRFEQTVVDGVEVWFDASGPDFGVEGAWLLPTFDEAFLSHNAPRFTRAAGHRLDQQHVNPAEAGGGVVIVDGRDVGTFKRTATKTRFAVTICAATGATKRDRDKAVEAAERLAAFVGRDAEVVVE
ncbi:winged helix DNA-binding domain-containing protein [Mariniluteicoccus flavus]